MCGIVEDLSDEDLEAVAAWYSGKTFVPAAQEFDAALAEAGSALHADNCENCHGEGGSLAGVGPRLAGQWIPYLKSTLKYVPTGEHQVPSMMERKLNEFSPDEMQALLNYYAGQQD
jgi:sulfide dehydrogenase cytochrome subunit